MKSAYELAMERLERTSGPTKKLTDAQKSAIAEIEQKYDAKLAEVRLGFEAKMKAAPSAAELAQRQTELAGEVERLEGKREAEKEAIWAAADGNA